MKRAVVRSWRARHCAAAGAANGKPGLRNGNSCFRLTFADNDFLIRLLREVAMKSKRAALYARVSTLDQHPELQQRELIQYVKRRGWAIQKVYTDKGISGAVERRPALDSLLQDCRRGRVDVVVVWKFDRFARSLRQLVDALELFRSLSIAFVSCTEAVDTSLPHGEMLFQIIGSIAQWERSLIGERVRAGLQHARQEGTRLGRPPRRVMTRNDVTELRNEWRRTKLPFRKLAAKYGTSVWTAHRICKEHHERER